MKRIFQTTILNLLFLFPLSLSAQINEESLNLSPSINNSVSRDLQFSMYPQPSTGQINLRFNEVQNHNPIIMVYDLLGNLVNTIETEKLNSTTFTLDLCQKKPGYYFVKIQSDYGTVSRRITIK